MPLHLYPHIYACGSSPWLGAHQGWHKQIPGTQFGGGRILPGA